MAVGSNILFDPTREELAVADAVLAISVGASHMSGAEGDVPRTPKLLAIRTIDPPSRLTPPGVPDVHNSATGGRDGAAGGQAHPEEQEMDQGVWRPPRGGMTRGLVGRVVKMVVEKGGVGEEVLAGLEGVGLG